MQIVKHCVFSKDKMIWANVGDRSLEFISKHYFAILHSQIGSMLTNWYTHSHLNNGGKLSKLAIVPMKIISDNLVIYSLDETL